MGISSHSLVFPQDLPLNNYFQFRHHMLSFLEAEQKTSEYITKLWNQLRIEANTVANVRCATETASS